jgi:hypothetical protein
MNKHTPGPWQARGSTVLANSHIGTNCTDADVAVYGAPLVCESIRSDANARLIAASPCMLEALRNIVNLWDHHASAHGDGTIFPLHEAARAAISKAEGV